MEDCFLPGAGVGTREKTRPRSQGYFSLGFLLDVPFPPQPKSVLLFFIRSHPEVLGGYVLWGTLFQPPEEVVIYEFKNKNNHVYVKEEFAVTTPGLSSYSPSSLALNSY